MIAVFQKRHALSPHEKLSQVDATNERQHILLNFGDSVMCVLMSVRRARPPLFVQLQHAELMQGGNLLVRGVRQP